VKKVLLMDIDGVLTDGMVYIDSRGNETKRLSFDDIEAIFELKRAGIKIGFITGEKNGFSEYIRRRFSPDYFASGCKDKLGYFRAMEEREGLDRSSVCYVGDSVKDVELLKYLDLSFAPSDAVSEAKGAAKRVLSATRGNGVVNEAARFMLSETSADLDSGERGNGKARAVTAMAIIPACEERDGLPHKYMKLLVGKPLIEYAIQACIETPGISRVAVCTDSIEIMEAARRCGQVEVIEISGEQGEDQVSTEEILAHSIKTLEGRGLEFDTVLFVHSTFPLTEPSDLGKLLERIGEGFDSTAFYTDDPGYFWEEGGAIRPSLPHRIRAIRKKEAGNACAFLKEGFLASKERTFGLVGLCKLEPPKDIDINTECHLHMVERMLQLRERKKRRLYWKARVAGPEESSPDFEAGYWGEVLDPDGNRRNRLLERKQRISDVREELEYINSLPPGRMLDIGCGMGDLLSAVADCWEKHGLEVSEFAAREASRYGNIFVGPLKSAPYREEYFDLVVMNHVIEHMESPYDEVKRVRAVLKHNGKLVIGTPDFDGAMARRYGPKYRLLNDRTHVSLFSRVSLRQFLEDHGFEVERESFPFFETRHFTRENLLRLTDTEGISPPFWGSFMTFYCVKK